MTDQNTDGSGRLEAVIPSRRWPKWLFVASLALNLVILGIIGGAALRHGRGAGQMIVRDLAFGPYSEALSRDDREALRRAFMDRPGAVREELQTARSEFKRLLEALRADPFVPSAVRTIFAEQQMNLSARLQLGHQLLLQRIETMDQTARIGFADRLEGALRRGHGPFDRPED